jgi:nucleotide-binding universal stress UspA family protein
MKILVSVAGPKPAKDNVWYVMNLAKKLRADVMALHISQKEDTSRGEETLKIFADAGKDANIKVIKRLKKGDIISNILETAEQESVNLIIMGATPVKVVAEWVSTGVIEKAHVPVIIIPYEFNKTP